MMAVMMVDIMDAELQGAKEKTPISQGKVHSEGLAPPSGWNGKVLFGS